MDRVFKTQIEKDKKYAKFLKRFEAIDSTGFSAADQLNKDLMIYQLKETLKNYDLKLYEMPLIKCGATFTISGIY